MAEVGDILNPIAFERRKIAIHFHIVRQDNMQEDIFIDGQYRIRANISNAGYSFGRSATLEIEGLPLSLVNRLCFIANYSAVDGKNVQGLSRSTVTVKAGVTGYELATIFVGNISEAYVDYAAAPDVIFRVRADTVSTYSQIVGDQVGYRKAMSPQAILSDLCARNGVTFYDHGGWEDARLLTCPYLNGDFEAQFIKIVNAVSGAWDFDKNGSEDRDGKQTGSLKIAHAWGPYAARGDGVDADKIPVISAQTGMLGYPRYAHVGCNVITIFRPEMAFYSLVKLESRYLPAAWNDLDRNGYNAMQQLVAAQDAQKTPWDGYWIITNVNHDLSCEIPNGPWLTSIECGPSTFVRNTIVR